ncbi:hypothetical protein ROZALSC1DRAFT_25661 [Rozella allomycis CSF55]|uniref:Uncharacterized protein n=1 Tax=Rozella allomycis (strain CSF55) TaxID=988480 RepID=A0A4P9YBY8_ROZAC|nr:hypothetical protein ROZALSC1DRAFT_25661 [Rozella allomycis CSF55]
MENLSWSIFIARFSDVSAMCSKCQVKVETVFHRFFDCESFSKRIWSTFFPETPNSRALFLFLFETEDFMNLRGKRILYYIHEAFKRNLLENQGSEITVGANVLRSMNHYFQCSLVSPRCPNCID